jgi:hypothetical protein
VVALEHVLSELRLENRQRVRQARQVARLPVVVESVLLHPERPYPRGVDMVLDRSRTARSVWDRAVALSGRRRRARREQDDG